MTADRSDKYRKARVIFEPEFATVWAWLAKGFSDLRRFLPQSLAFGILTVAAIWVMGCVFVMLGLAWMLLPAAAGAVLIGPMVTSYLYHLARQRSGTGPRQANTSQLVLTGIILTVFALVWIRAATILFAVFFGLRPFARPLETMQIILTTPAGLGLLLTGTLVGGLFAALGFAVSAFSVPMLVDRDIDAFSAMGLSFNAVTHNFRLVVTVGSNDICGHDPYRGNRVSGAGDCIPVAGICDLACLCIAVSPTRTQSGGLTNAPHLSSSGSVLSWWGLCLSSAS